MTVDAIRSTTVVAVPPERAFRIFTEEIDAWWQRGPRFRFLVDAPGTLAFERVGDEHRLVEHGPEGDRFDVGRVLDWDPPRRLAFELGARAFSETETTRVDIHFESEGESGERTRVSVVHSGWAQIAEAHPVRHGMDERSWEDMMGVWWGDLLAALSRYAPARAV